MSSTSFPAFTSLPNLQNLPFLLRLMDDASPVVREKIAAQLRAIGAAVWPEIERRQLTLTSDQRVLLETILATGDTPASWLDWLELERENEKLEAAFCWLARHNAGNLSPPADVQLRQSLDALAREYLLLGGAPDPEELSAFLFVEKELSGASGDSFYAPENSDLRMVLQNRRGLPISLVSIFILVGARLDIEIFGCDLPGHFMARAPFGDDDEADLIFDCFDAGRVLAPAEVYVLRLSAPQALNAPARARDIIARVMRNYATAYHVAGNQANTLLYLDLLQQLEEADTSI